MIPGAVPSGLSCIKEGLDLCWIEEIFRAMRIDSLATLNIFRVGSDQHWCSASTWLWSERPDWCEQLGRSLILP